MRIRNNMVTSIYFDATPTNNILCCVDLGNSSPWFKSMKGKLTNNDLEWYALLSAVKYCSVAYTKSYLTIYGDSKLVVNQFNDTWKINKEEFKIIKEQIGEYIKVNNEVHNDIIVNWLPREENRAGIELDDYVKKQKKLGRLA